MYKITLFDETTDSFVSGTATFFTDDLALFEKHCILEKTTDTQERYFRSKNGECVTDYYSDAPELNMVQFDADCELLASKSFAYQEKHITLLNFYGFKTELFASDVLITLAHIKHNGTYFLIGKYKLLGVCTKSRLDNTLYNKCTAYGNPICIETISGKALQLEEETEKAQQEFFECRKNNEPERVIETARMKLFQSHSRADPKDFAGCDIETCCYVTINKYKNRADFDMEEIEEMTADLFVRLMQDIPGSCG